MKKTHWFRNTLIVLIICGLIGTVLAAILFNKEAGRASTSAAIQFSFNGAAEGKAPNGYPFDLSGITSDEVLNTALEASGLTGKYTAEQLRNNITVSGVYPESIVKRMTQYVSLMDKEAESQASVADYHATEYSVTLYSDFDTAIASGKLTELLRSILTAYRTYFAKTYGVNLENTMPIADLMDYDYTQQLDALLDGVKQESRYAQVMAKMAPGFCQEGKSFSDLVAQYNDMKSDVEKLDASVTLNAISKNPERLKAQYETEIRTQQFKLESLNEELTQIEEQVKAYDKDGIIYVSAGGTLQEIGNDKSGTYDKLVSKHKEVTDQISAAKAKITLYQGRLDDMTGKASKEGEEEAAVVLTDAEKEALQETIEQKLMELVAKKEAVSKAFASMLDAYTAQEINESTVVTTSAKYNKPSLFSVTFVVKVVKTSGPICAVGFMVCMVLLIRDRRKEEKIRKV